MGRHKEPRNPQGAAGAGVQAPSRGWRHGGATTRTRMTVESDDTGHGLTWAVAAVTAVDTRVQSGPEPQLYASSRRATADKPSQ